MKNVCNQCIKFFRLRASNKHFYTYHKGLCEGCLREAEVTDPSFYLTLEKNETFRRYGWSVLETEVPTSF